MYWFFKFIEFRVSCRSHEFINILSSYFYSPHIIKPTRITHYSATLIDNIFLNSLSHHTISGNLIYDLTDHLPNFIIINKFMTLPKNFSKVIRDYSNFDPDKLFFYGIRGIAFEWFKSYLCNRKQFVSIGNSNSDIKPIPMGVPQGSVIGPLLFLLYLNDLPNCSDVLDFHLFADDTNLFFSSSLS